jgi:hypothetical protein
MTVEGQGQSKPYLPIELPQSAWRGVFADYRDLVANTTEAPDSYHFGVCALVLGATLGRRVWVHYANRIYPNFDLCLLGSSGIYRKTTAWRRGQGLLNKLHVPPSDPEDEMPFQTIPGIGSAEGLLDALNGERKVVVLAEDEFRSLLTKARQEALSNLIPKLTELFGCPDIATLQTRNKKVIASEPFLSIVTGTTQAWLEKSLVESAIHGGFANRFLYILGEPKPPMPYPEKVDWRMESRLVEQ